MSLPTTQAPYRHLTHDDRVALAALSRAQAPQKAIATQLKKHRTTLWRERQRNASSDGVYAVREAQRKTNERRLRANERFRKLSHDPHLQHIVEFWLRRYCSPDQIAGHLRETCGVTVISHRTIYTWIREERPDLKRYLRCQKGRYRRKKGTKKREKAREEAKKRRIDVRPEIVDQRRRIGDWEGDTIVGKGRSGFIATFTERRSGYEVAAKLTHQTAREMRAATQEQFTLIPKEKRLTFTLDNGSEMAEYEMIERDLAIDIYFAHPYHSWERGTNENTNGLLRQFFPKKRSFTTVTQEDVDWAVDLLNHRPRKRLTYRTPCEVFGGCCGSD